MDVAAAATVDARPAGEPFVWAVVVAVRRSPRTAAVPLDAGASARDARDPEAADSADEDADAEDAPAHCIQKTFVFAPLPGLFGSVTATRKCHPFADCGYAASDGEYERDASYPVLGDPVSLTVSLNNAASPVGGATEIVTSYVPVRKL
jgi:hypothetical protein